MKRFLNFFLTLAIFAPLFLSAAFPANARAAAAQRRRRHRRRRRLDHRLAHRRN